MFVVEFSGGIKAASLSLTGDSLDMLGDALVYGCSLYVIQKSKKAQARAAMLKGTIMYISAGGVAAAFGCSQCLLKRAINYLLKPHHKFN